MPVKKATTVLFRREAGPLVHTMGAYEWSEATDWLCAVDVETAANLIGYPRPVFFLAERPSAEVRREIAAILGVSEENIVWPAGGAEPATKALPTLPSITGEERAAELAGLGISSTSALAALNDEEIAELSVKSGATRKEITAWVEQAKSS